MATSQDFKILYSNEAAKKLTGVIFASDDDSTSPCSAWGVFKERKSLTFIPEASTISFEYYRNGEAVSTGSLSAKIGSSWLLTTEGEDETVILKETTRKIPVLHVVCRFRSRYMSTIFVILLTILLCILHVNDGCLFRKS